ncbi:MAG: hypothetical protein K2X49_23680 [Acetobacteraceae bacterium]|nr:hypothetical protein [Acetobacteraceae bacterium]
MRRARTITLLLLGGGAMTAAVAAFPTRSGECRAARAAQDKFADEICGRSGSSSTRTGSGFWGGRSSGGATTAASSRGGFGGSAASFSGSGG